MSDLFEGPSFHPVSAGAPEPDPGGRRAAREERERASRRRTRRRRTFAITVVVLLGLGLVVWQVLLPQWTDMADSLTSEDVTDYPGPGQGEVDVVIPAGATGSAMADVLVEADVVAGREAFIAAFSANPSASRIQPGTYTLLRQMTAADAVAGLLDPDNRRRTVITFPEGRSAAQILDRLAGTAAVSMDELSAALADIEATGLPVGEVEPLADETPEQTLVRRYEGWLFAGTYEWEPDTTATQMIADMVGRTISHLDDREVAPEDRERVLVMASLVEREARSSEDRHQVARAILNRLEITMKLDIDAAVAYGLGIPGTELTRALIETTDGPYNLYRTTGLPPTPIASPSLESIDAVLAPADGPWLFWVTINLETGETLFAETLAEHEANVALLREWQAQQSAEPTEP